MDPELAPGFRGIRPKGFFEINAPNVAQRSINVPQKYVDMEAPQLWPMGAVTAV